MRTYTVWGFVPLHGATFEPTKLTVLESIPEIHALMSLGEAAACFRREAETIFDMLTTSLPQGTLDRLLLLLLASRASYYVGKPGSPSPVPVEIEI